MRRLLPPVALLAALAMPMAAQTQSGWKVRADAGQNVSAPESTPSLTFKGTGKGFQMAGGSAGIFFDPAHPSRGCARLFSQAYTISTSSEADRFRL